MKAINFFVVALTLACAPLAASAHESVRSKQYNACIDKPSNTTMSMIECTDAEFRRQDARLNKAYKTLMADLTAPRKAKLQETQRLWIKYRDANCDFYNDPDGGSMARIAANTCMLTETTDRASELEALHE